MSPTNNKARRAPGSVEQLQMTTDEVILAQPAQKIGNSEFMAAIFGKLEPGEYCWTTAFIESPNKAGPSQWSGKPTRPEHCEDTPARNTYFSVAVLREVAGKRKRQKSHFCRLPCVVLDDSNGCALEPSWRLVTSEGKEQTGYRLTVPESDVEVAERLHKALSKGGLVPADKSGNNPVRYVRLPVGTNTKYSEPFAHRLVEWNPEVSHDLDELIEALGFDVDLIRQGKPAKGSISNPTPAVREGDRQSDAELIRLIQTAESYHDPLLTYSARLAQRGIAERAIVDTLQGIMAAVGDDSERWQQRYDDIPRQVRTAVEKFSPPDDPVARALLQHPTQDNVALVFRQQLVGKMLYAHKFGSWFEWDGGRWKREGTGKAFDYARNLARAINKEGKASLSSASFCNGVETLAKNDRAFAVSGEEFDLDNYLLNTPAGTFDLRTNLLRPHDPNDRITLTTTVAPSPEGGERFRLFLEEVTGGDAELIRFLKVSLGACLSGAVESHWMLFWTGNGRNGKNTLGDLVMDVIGDYGRKIPASTLMAKTYEAHPTELANLAGIRLATASEVSDGDHWHEARINELTGDATISARFMRGDLFTFKRTHKHLIYGNHRPQLRSVTEAIKSRIRIVPFSQSFIGREDPMLPDKLRREAGYVLHWLIEGHAEWLALGRKLPPCRAVTQESDNYFAEQSTVDMWISEQLTVLTNDERPAYDCPQSSTLYNLYTYWKKDRGESPVSQSRWAESMRRFERVKSNGVRYRGVKLAEDLSDLI